jgi:pimeloyl-ACP methyl ester carboxylesterase
MGSWKLSRRENLCYFSGMIEGIENRIELGFVLIPGAGLPASIWDEVRKHLNAPSIAIQYADRLSSGRKRKDFSIQDYADQALGQISQARFKKVILVSHSIGGIVGLQVADFLKSRVETMVAVSAAIPKQGKSVLSTVPQPFRILAYTFINLFGTTPPRAAIRKTLCNDLPDDVAHEIANDYRAESKLLYFDPNPVGMPACSKVYVTLTNDKALLLSTQEKMADNFSAKRIRTLDTGHLPMLANPKGLAKILNDTL